MSGANSTFHSLRKSIAGGIVILILACLAGLITNHFTKNLASPAAEEMNGVPLVSVKEAVQLQNEGALFVDARTQEAYAQGHIPGAYLLDYFQFDEYFPGFIERFPKSTKMVVYCEGISGPQLEDTCHTSKLLAEQLSQVGYTNVLLFEGGYSFWNKESQRSPGTSGTAAAESKKASPFNTAFQFSALVLGIIGLIYRRNKTAVSLLGILLGGIFVYAGSTKILHAKEMAVILTSYGILPDALVNISAMTIPWVELLAGLFLLLGILQPAGAFVIACMNLFFIPALSYRALGMMETLKQSFFQVNFDCGCGLGENFAWIIILRDIGFLLMSVAIVLGHPRWNVSNLFRK